MSVYDNVRWDQHKTLGDAAERRNRDSDAFAAGAQYALDTILARTGPSLAAFSPVLPVFTDGIAADILSALHEGRFV